ATALETHPRIRQAVVTVHDENLLAHYVPGQPAPEPAELKTHLAALLPGYMVPTTYIALTALPLTPNGKIDRKALPHPDAEQRPTGQGRAPQTAAEQLVAEIYAEVLDLTAQVHAEDDFFALGGHSLRAAMLTARLNARSGAAIPVGDVFRHPVVADLARQVEAAAPGTISAPVPRPEGTQPPLSPAQERLWFLARLDPQDASYNMWMAKRLRGPLDESALRRALDAVTTRHEILRTRFPEADGEPTAVVEPPSAVPVEVLTAADEHAAAELVSARTNTPLDLGAAPPLRATLIRLGADDHVVLLVMHHILGDGWSLNILYDELAALYSGRELAPLPVQFGDIALWQRGQDTTEALAYWQQRLTDPTPLGLPLDRPRAAVPKRRGALTALRLDARDTAALTRTGREHGSTMFMVLLAAYHALLARHTGQNDILVGTVTAGRDRLELEPAIGYLTDVLVLRADLTDNPTLGTLLDRTRDDVLAAFAHQGIPFEELAARLRVVRDPARTPLFQTMAILHTEDAEHAADAFAGLRTSTYDGGFEQAKFDLMLEAWQDDDGLLVTFVYDAEIFDAATIERMTERFARLLRALPDHTATPFAAVPILSPDDTTVLDGPHLTETPAFLDQFAEQVRLRPDAIALTCGDQHLTYAQLDTRARHLATTLPH
ncbi:condensation domain-containing protein, partial [Streptomyces sp. NPDC021203]